MAKISLFGSLTNIQMLLYTLLHGKRVGRDAGGNTYYRGKARKGAQKERRWVIYQDRPEASSIPPEWHAWIHYQTDKLPEEIVKNYGKSWQKPHHANQTGTNHAYLPPGHAARGGKRDATTGDYTAWQPPQ